MAAGDKGYINATGEIAHSCTVNDVNIALSASGDGKTLSGSNNTQISQTGTTRWYLQHTGTQIPGNANGSSVDTTAEMGRGTGPVRMSTGERNQRCFGSGQLLAAMSLLVLMLKRVVTRISKLAHTP